MGRRANDRPEIWSEDHFFAFRGWLIAHGRQVYETAVADPDSLADYADLRTDWPPGSWFPWYWGEGLWAVALNAYGNRTGHRSTHHLAFSFLRYCGLSLW